ncbi:hypothetical protein AAEH73_06300 [Shewanella algae]|uniref:hypothetical protein n=1 Tax=Shewanella algae TaxID=38313 RepID=UPI001AAD8BAC|nr:hypothetical protein [Shewanella algae]QTE82580.1 hypothetical protein JKK46_01280 [Shewanella algae]
MRYYFRTISTTLLSAVLFVFCGFAANADEGQISFIGSVVDPGCELQQQGINCYQAEKSAFQYTALPFGQTALALDVGERLSLAPPSARLDLIEVSRVAEAEMLISASFN